MPVAYSFGLSECIIQIRNPKEGSQKAKFAHLWPEEVSVIKSLPIAMPHLNFFRHEKGNSGITAGQTFGSTYLNRWVKRACTILGIEGITLYPLVKHSTITAASKLLTPEHIQQWGSKHASKAMLRYMIPRYENTIRYQNTIRELQQGTGVFKVIKTKK
jgi:hypothetical protein